MKTYPHWADDYDGWLAQFDCFPRYEKKEEKSTKSEVLSLQERYHDYSKDLIGEAMTDTKKPTQVSK